MKIQYVIFYHHDCEGIAQAVRQYRDGHPEAKPEELKAFLEDTFDLPSGVAIYERYLGHAPDNIIITFIDGVMV